MTQKAKTITDVVHGKTQFPSSLRGIFKGKEFMIYFKIVPIIGADLFKEEVRFSTFNNRFLTIKLKDVNHEEFLKNELKERFSADCLISRSFFVINNNSDIYIYTFVITVNDSFANSKNMTIKEILESDFDEFDKLAIQDYYQKSF